MRCLVLFRYVLCLVTFSKPLDMQEQGKVFENKKKNRPFFLCEERFLSCMAFSIYEVFRLACLLLGT